MKDIQIEIKSNLQGTNSRGDEAKNQNNVLEHKEAKINQSEKQQGKKNPKKTRIESVASGTTSNVPTFPS